MEHPKPCVSSAEHRPAHCLPPLRLDFVHLAPHPKTGSPVPVSESKKASSQQHVPSSPPACTQSSSLHPLYSPSTLIVGDSIIRNVCFFNAATHCLPGATAPVILGKLKELIPSLPSFFIRIIVHVGRNDTARQQSELTKAQQPF